MALAARCPRRARRRDEDHLRGRLDRVRRPCPATAAPRSASPSIRSGPHPAIDAVGIDFYPPISDWRDGPGHADARRGAQRRTTSPICAAPRRRRGLRLVLRERRGRARAGAHADHRRRLWQALDLPRQGPRGLVVEPACRAGRRGRDRRRPPGCPQVEADLADRDRRPGRRQGPERAERLPRSEILGIGAPALLARRPRRPRPGARARGDPVPLRSRARRPFAPARNPVSTGLWRAAWSTRHTSSSGPGTRGPFRPSRTSTSVWADGANWETGHWITGRLEGAAARPADRRHPGRFRPAGWRRSPSTASLDGYVIDRPMSARAALEPLGAPVRHRRGRARAAGLRWRGPRRARRRRRSTPDDLVEAGKEPLLRLVRAQETELPHQVELGFTDGEMRVPPRHRRVAAPRRHEPPRDARRGRRRDAPGRGAAPRRGLAAGPLGRPRDGGVRSLAPAPRARARRRRLRADRGRSRGCTGSSRIADGPTRRVTTRAVEPAVFDAGAPRAPRRRARRGRRREASAPAAARRRRAGSHRARPARPRAASRPRCSTSPSRPIPGPGRSRSGARAEAEASPSIACAELPAMSAARSAPLGPGPLWRWDPTTRPRGRARPARSLPSPTKRRSRAATSSPCGEADGRWEILSAAGAELVGGAHLPPLAPSARARR